MNEVRLFIFHRCMEAFCFKLVYVTSLGKLESLNLENYPPSEEPVSSQPSKIDLVRVPYYQEVWDCKDTVCYFLYQAYSSFNKRVSELCSLGFAIVPQPYQQVHFEVFRCGKSTILFLYLLEIHTYRTSSARFFLHSKLKCFHSCDNSPIFDHFSVSLLFVV